MKLRSLHLRNFRQFYGEPPPIRFAEGKDRNVTLILGANGAGKTTLLNAFTWLLYAKTTPGLAKPELLVSERAIAEAKIGTDVEARVSLEFDHDEKTYLASRAQVVRKTANPIAYSRVTDGIVTLAITDELGNTRHSENPSETLSSILPERLHSFFFFDGERIEQLAKESAYAEVGEAIRNLLGLELLERALKHLRSDVKRKLDTELGAYGNNELKQLIDEIGRKEDRMIRLVDERKNMADNVSAIDSEIGDVKSRLRELAETSDLQNNLDQREKQEENVKAAIAETDQKIRELVSTQGFTAFLIPLVDKANRVLVEKRKKGEIPSGIKRPFVEDLLEEGVCICGRPLKKGEPPFKKVSQWLDKAGLDDVEEAGIKVGLQFRNYVTMRQSFFVSLSSFIEKRKADRELLHEVRERLSELKTKLGEVGRREAETIKGLIDKQHDFVNKLSEGRVRLGAADGEISRLRVEIEGMERQKNEAQARDVKAQLVQRRLRVLVEAGTFFERLHSLRSSEVREELDKRIKKIYSAISYKDYWPEITPDYRLALRKGMKAGTEEVSLDVAKSTGENQVLSLSFIGSVVDYARERYAAYLKDPNKEGLGFTGGIYPMVMDSPFGALDVNYQKPVAEGLPKLADQIIIMASRSQALGVVYETIRPSLDATYVLSYFTPKHDLSAESLDLLGRKVPYISKSNSDHEWAEIVEVK